MLELISDTSVEVFKQLVIANRLVKISLFVLWQEALDVLEVVALLVHRPQSLNGLNLQELCESLVGKLLGKRLDDDLELPVTLVKLEVLDVFVGCLDQNCQVRLVLAEVVLF